MTCVGLAAALLGGSTPRWNPQHGCFVAANVGGPSRFLLGQIGADANTVGHVVLSTRERMTQALIAHESVHVRQIERLGPLFMPAYLWMSALYGYRDNPFERAARIGAQQLLNAGREEPAGRS